MRDVVVKLPEIAFSSLRKTVEEMALELKLSAVVKWFELGIISQNKAAEICEMSRFDFLKILGKYNVSVIDYTEEELKEEVEKFSKIIDRGLKLRK